MIHSRIFGDFFQVSRVCYKTSPLNITKKQPDYFHFKLLKVVFKHVYDLKHFLVMITFHCCLGKYIAFFALVTHIFCDGCWFSWFLRRFPWEVFFATVVGVFCDGPGRRACFLRRLAMSFPSVGCVFCVGGILRRSWPEGMFFATVGHVFSIGRVCFLRRWNFATVTHVFCDGWRGAPRCSFLWVAHVFCDSGRGVFCVGKSCFLRRFLLSVLWSNNKKNASSEMFRQQQSLLLPVANPM